MHMNIIPCVNSHNNNSNGTLGYLTITKLVGGDVNCQRALITVYPTHILATGDA